MRHLESWNGDTFRRLREARGTTAGELADLLGIVEERVCRWERGEEIPHGHARELLDAWMAEEGFPGRG